MSHLTEEMLNLYLDGELPPGQLGEAENHLAGCNACRVALKELEAVFDNLAAWTPAALPFDISQRVMAELKPAPKPRRVTALAWAGLGFQGLLSLLLGVMIIPWLAGLSLPGLGALDYSPVWQSLGDWFTGLPGLLSTAGNFLPNFSLNNISVAVWAGAAFALAFGWLVLNRLLLKGFSQSSNQHLKGDH